MSSIPKNEPARKIEVVAHDPHWKMLFQTEAASIVQNLGENILRIHHIGSTAIPAIKAKPIIDILLVVKSLTQLDNSDDKMIALGYEPMGENGITGRRFYQKIINGVRKYHIHAFEEENPEIQRHLDFINYLLAHPDIAEQYSTLKEQLAKRFPTDIGNYINGKRTFIENIDRKARAAKQSLNLIKTLNTD